MRRGLAVLGAGLLFGVGLVISGMTDPRNVIGFLDFAGDWNPSLAGVMVGAIGVHMTLLAILRRRGGARVQATVAGGTRVAGIDLRLVAGAAIFGVGWGLSGYCPGPAIVSLGLGLPIAFGFLAAMIAGTLAADAFVARSARARSAGDPTSAEPDLTCSAEG